MLRLNLDGYRVKKAKLQRSFSLKNWALKVWWYFWHQRKARRWDRTAFNHWWTFKSWTVSLQTKKIVYLSKRPLPFVWRNNNLNQSITSNGQMIGQTYYYAKPNGFISFENICTEKKFNFKVEKGLLIIKDGVQRCLVNFVYALKMCTWKYPLFW